MKCMIEWVKKIIPDEIRRSLSRKSLGNEVLRKKNVFGRWKDTKVSREIERSESEIAQTLYIEPLKSQQIERCRGLNFDRCIYRATIQRCPQQKQARWIEKLSSNYRGDRNFLDGSRSYLEAIEIVIKKNLKSSIDKPGVERCRGAVEIA